MSEQGVDAGKRRFLTTATVVAGGVGAAFVAVPFIKSWQPSERAKAAGAPVEINISKVDPGAQVTVLWRGKPVWVIRRTPKLLASLEEAAKELRDPDSKEPQQPAYCQNEARSIKPEVLVMVGICTHLGCIPEYKPKGDPGLMPLPGFFCPCHGSKYDMAGRVYKDVPAPLNMVVPPYHYASDDLVQVGVGPAKSGEKA